MGCQPLEGRHRLEDHDDGRDVASQVVDGRQRFHPAVVRRGGDRCWHGCPCPRQVPRISADTGISRGKQPRQTQGLNGPRSGPIVVSAGHGGEQIRVWSLCDLSVSIFPRHLSGPAASLRRQTKGMLCAPQTVAIRSDYRNAPWWQGSSCRASPVSRHQPAGDDLMDDLFRPGLTRPGSPPLEVQGVRDVLVRPAVLAVGLPVQLPDPLEGVSLTRA